MNIITTYDQLDELVAHYKTQDAFAYDVETVGDRRGDTPVNTVLWISLATYGRVDVIPMGHPNGDLEKVEYPLTGQGLKRVAQGLPARPSDHSIDAKKAISVFTAPPKQLFQGEVFRALEPLLFDPNILKIGHNLIFDLTSVAKYFGGSFPVGPYFDTMIGSFLYDNSNKHKVSLEECAYREFGYQMVKGVGKAVEMHSFADVAKYAAIDAKYTFLLWKTIADKLKAANVENIMALEMEVLPVLCDMKLTGAPIDVDGLQKLSDELNHDIEKATEKIFRAAGRPFNLNSNPEKQLLLYSPKSEGGRGLKPQLLTPKGEEKSRADLPLSYADYSVSAEAFEKYRGKDALVDAILEYTELNKLNTTYIVPYLGGEVTRTSNGKSKVTYKDSLLINGRVHGNFKQHGAETGRFSSDSPNLQNIPNPKASERGRAIRNLFIAPEGYKLVVADYSQIEPRIIASMSGDESMINGYLNGVDLYTTVGGTLGISRDASKTLVLSIAYGTGARNISGQIGCTISEAKDLLADFDREFPSVNRYKRKVINATRAHNPPYVSTILGRKRYVPEINSKDEGLRKGAERQAFNTRIQGSAADLIKLAMVRAYKMIPEGSKLILTVHDELVTLAPNHLAEKTLTSIKSAMEGIDMLKVPLIAEANIVQRWGEAK